MYSSQLPGNLILRRFGVRNVIGCSVVGWGAVQLGMGFVPRWGDLALCRVLLGACEVTIIFFIPELVLMAVIGVVFSCDGFCNIHMVRSSSTLPHNLIPTMQVQTSRGAETVSTCTAKIQGHHS